MDMSAACYLNSIDPTDTTFDEKNRTVYLRSVLVSNYDYLHRRLLRYLGCPEQASDSLQDTWLRLGEMKLPASIKSPEAYVYRVACNLAIDELRSYRPWQYSADSEASMSYLADTAPGPELISEIRSEVNALDRALSALPRRHQDVLKCLRLEDLTRQQVAARHGVSLRSVDTMLRQALDHCADQTGQLVSGGVSTPRRCLPLLHRQVKSAATTSLGI
ncbi:putative RNA polymerase sigma factor FecI [compost metagenome]